MNSNNQEENYFFQKILLMRYEQDTARLEENHM